MTTLQRTLAVASRATKKRFAVVTWGCSASVWLTGVLNDIPGIVAVHEGRTMWEAVTGSRHLAAGEYMDLVAALSPGEAVGDVGSLSVDEAEAAGIPYVALTRDPLARACSYFALLKNVLGEECTEHNLSLGAGMLNSITSENSGRLFRMEDITSYGWALRDFVYLLTGVTVPLAWAENAVRTPPVNVHGGALSQREREIALRAMTPRARDAYAALGYEVA